jgi:predicted nucleic acid-binding protein
MLVVDASVTMAWCFEDEATRATDALLDRVATEGAVVPQLWGLEVCNVLLVAQRKGRITEAQSARFLALLHQLPMISDPAGTPLPELLAVAARHGLTAYDAAYLALAERNAAALATLDADLRDAATAAGVELA